ncbi:MAG: response regulator [Proteobacteria bacterium]|jgi:DNA-binding response OmpR family regulator|nr:MAG: response regulator [Pseudomonadota bacterium]
MDLSLSGLRVLIVEDEPLLAWELELSLAAAGAIVIGPASTLSLGLALADDESLDAAVIDYRLGHEEAVPLAAMLYERGTPFVIHTGHGTNADGGWWSAPIVRKPSNPDRIVQILAALVRNEGALQHSFTSNRPG